ncbi:hypothetical protein SUGI_1168290 [Cryptomeria japonica]|nr:hypothetical protein SUGI_1168290 [Cryptomeria japonica]
MTILYNSISADCNKVAVSNALIRDNNLRPAEVEVVFYLVTPWWIPSIRPWKPWDMYNNNLIKRVLSNIGTPKRPGKSMEVFIFTLLKENMKGGDETERHFGLFYPNKTLVYPVNFYH